MKRGQDVEGQETTGSGGSPGRRRRSTQARATTSKLKSHWDSMPPHRAHHRTEKRVMLDEVNGIQENGESTNQTKCSEGN